MLLFSLYFIAVDMEECLEDDCISCFRETKYICILCLLPVCNICSVAELDDEIEGWVAGRRVGYCSDCNKYNSKSNKAVPDKQSVIQSNFNLKATVNSRYIVFNSSNLSTCTM